MTPSEGQQYATAAAFRRALDDRLKTEAKRRQRPVNELRREFLFQRFLALVFVDPGGPWVLKGGAGLLVRLSTARFSQDLDLLYRGDDDLPRPVDELRRLARPRPGNFLMFIVGDVVSFSQTNPVEQIKVTAYIGAAYDKFTIDVARGLHMIAVPERVRPVPVVEMPGLPELPEVDVYPLADQIADKVCAMYERHGPADAPSSRFRDLHDLALIVATYDLDGHLLNLALAAECQRRNLVVPTVMTSPGPQWQTGYRTLARTSQLPAHLRELTGALELVGACLNPILSGERTSGSWTGEHWNDWP